MSTANFTSPQSSTPFLSKGARGVDPHYGGHVVQFYTDDDFLLDGLSRFIGIALAAGDGAVVIATKAHRKGLSQRMKARGVDPAPAFAAGRFIELDASDTLSKFMVNGLPDAGRFANLMGRTVAQATAAHEGQRPRVAAFGEMVALLWEQGKAEAAIRLEELWNDLARTHCFSLRCAYPMRHFDREEHGESFLKICAAHGGVIPGENYTTVVTEDDRSRVIAGLQQKAQALATEISERKRVEEELRRSKTDLESLVEQRTAALRQLSARLLQLRDSERRRIARELNDCLGQYLIALKLNVDMLRQSTAHENLWVESEELVQECLTEVRTLSYLLHPPTMDAAGLVSAAHWFVDEFRQRTGIRVTLTAARDLARLPDETEITLFRCLQEALNNMHRHSGCSAGEILIERNEAQVVLQVKDNGCGMQHELLDRFRKTGNGLGIGLAAMCERVRDLGGDLQLDSDYRGTSVRVRIPVKQPSSLVDPAKCSCE